LLVGIAGAAGPELKRVARGDIPVGQINTLALPVPLDSLILPESPSLVPAILLTGPELEGSPVRILSVSDIETEVASEGDGSVRARLDPGVVALGLRFAGDDLDGGAVVETSGAETRLAVFSVTELDGGTGRLGAGCVDGNPLLVDLTGGAVIDYGLCTVMSIADVLQTLRMPGPLDGAEAIVDVDDPLLILAPGRTSPELDARSNGVRPTSHIKTEVSELDGLSSAGTDIGDTTGEDPVLLCVGSGAALDIHVDAV